MAGQQSSQAVSRWVWVSLAALVLLALAVIFVLPGVVERYELPLVKRPEPAATEVVTGNSGGNATASAGSNVSPFEEAQLARQRRSAQDILASLLERQSELEAFAVEEWAPDAFNEALAQAEEGDTFYRQGDFEQAEALYQQADDSLAELQAARDDEYQSAMESGQMAMDEGDAETAMAAFGLASRIQPSSQDAADALDRANVLEEVMALLADGQSLAEAGELESARDRYQEALNLDPAHPQAQALKIEIEQTIVDRNFSAAMSAGFTALQSGDIDTAIASFQDALAIKPGSDQAEAAIQQARDQVELSEIARIREQAEAHEANERWQQAIDAYQEALDLDGNLIFAQDGKDYSQRRLQLDQLMQANLDDPLRLSDQAVYQEAQNVLAVASDLASDLRQDGIHPGDRLLSQIDELTVVLDKVIIPKDITLTSDGSTFVTLYRVAELGTFEQTTVTLTPGRYVAVGTRSGYRDVREEFVVGLDDAPAAVSIRCHDQIASAE